MVSSLCYASETWGDKGSDVEVVYRYGLRTALGVRQTTNNEIIYIESNKFPLKCQIMKQQLKFWLNVKEYIQNNPQSALDCFVRQAQRLNVKYIKYYETLESKYVTPDNCIKSLQTEYQRIWKTH